MPHQDDNSDRPKTLPPPELDPTLNPVLGQNMGRWAEVYFTSAPDKREEAVLELLRTLEAENGAGAEGQVAPPLVVDRPPVPQVSLKSKIAEGAPRLIECHSCGRENRAHQRFCGMCGAPLQKEAVSDLREEPPQVVSAPSLQNWERIPPLERVFEEPALTPSEFAPAHDGVEPDSTEDRLNHLFDESPGSNSHLYYIGAALAIVIFAISYIAWRGAHATSGRSQLGPQARSELSRQPGTPAPIPVAPNVAPSVSNQSAAPAQPASKTAGTNPSAEESTPATTAQSAEEKNPQPVAISGSGSEELATARRYLNGTDGQERNTSEAVNWLWKAVAKRNTEATLLLSDIFLKGNGVPQNCDQAHVLLDAAASRGSKDAAERLRHLQAFGCQ